VRYEVLEGLVAAVRRAGDSAEEFCDVPQVRRFSTSNCCRRRGCWMWVISIKTPPPWMVQPSGLPEKKDCRQGKRLLVIKCECRKICARVPKLCGHLYFVLRKKYGRIFTVFFVVVNSEPLRHDNTPTLCNRLLNLKYTLLSFQ